MCWLPGRLEQLCNVSDSGVTSHEIVSMTILLASTDFRMVIVCYMGKYVHEVLVNCLVKLAQEEGG